MRHPNSAGLGKRSAGEALRELREEMAWSAWAEEGGSGDGAGRARRSEEIFFLRVAGKAEWEAVS